MFPIIIEKTFNLEQFNIIVYIILYQSNYIEHLFNKIKHICYIYYIIQYKLKIYIFVTALKKIFLCYYFWRKNC